MSNKEIRNFVRELILEKNYNIYRWEDPDTRYQIDSEDFNDLIQTGKIKTVSTKVGDETTAPEQREKLKRAAAVQYIIDHMNPDVPEDKKEGVRQALDHHGNRPKTVWAVAQALAPFWDEFSKDVRSYTIDTIPSVLPEWADRVADIGQSRVGKGGNEIGKGEFAAALLIDNSKFGDEASGRVDLEIGDNINVHVKSTIDDLDKKTKGVTFYNVRPMPDEYFDPVGDPLQKSLQSVGVDPIDAKMLCDWIWGAIKREYRPGSGNRKGSAPSNFNTANLLSKLIELDIMTPEVWDLVSDGLRGVAKNMVDAGKKGYVLIFFPGKTYVVPSTNWWFVRTSQSKDGALSPNPPQKPPAIEIINIERNLIKTWDTARDSSLRKVANDLGIDTARREEKVLRQGLGPRSWSIRNIRVLAKGLSKIDPECEVRYKKSPKDNKGRISRADAVDTIMMNYISSVRDILEDESEKPAEPTTPPTTVDLAGEEEKEKMPESDVRSLIRDLLKETDFMDPDRTIPTEDNPVRVVWDERGVTKAMFATNEEQLNMILDMLTLRPGGESIPYSLDYVSDLS
jgi:hypothetical protein